MERRTICVLQAAGAVQRNTLTGKQGKQTLAAAIEATLALFPFRTTDNELFVLLLHLVQTVHKCFS